MSEITYAAAGVDVAAADAAVERIRRLACSTGRPGVVSSVGGFAGLFALDTGRWRRPLLVSSTDGVGTKMLVARATGRYDSVGVDLVAMCVDDLVCAGAEPLFLLDYVAVGRLVPDRIEMLVSGVAEGCRAAGCALIGGETAEHPDAMGPDDVDLAGFAVGVVEQGAELGPARVRAGDVLVGLASPGLRSNGYTLARQVLLGRAGLPLDGPAWEGASHTLADELLRPSVVYAPAVLAALRAGGGVGDAVGAAEDAVGAAGGGIGGAVGAAGGAVHACAHVTGGGIAGNLVRVLPDGVAAHLDRGSWEVPRIFGEIARLGPVDDAEMLRVFNLGLGMVLVVDPAGVDAVIGAVRSLGHWAAVVGDVRSGEREVSL